MEGLIPYVYRVIVRYRSGGHASMAASWFCESPPPASYVRLPGDSGRFQTTDIHQLFRPERLIPASPSPSSVVVGPPPASQLITSSNSAQSPMLRHLLG
ncbi:hypothetical protein ACLOJK_012653 [Asimina triloba]